ncbi:MAG TPA: hypothetical protein VLL03_06400, partial [Burkholderiales bacterium]|nr:hypothetical protein [Burkholderiales bacterium]
MRKRAQLISDVRHDGFKMSTLKYHLDEQEIPDGFQIFEERLEVAGVGFRKEDAAAFVTAKDGWLEL